MADRLKSFYKNLSIPTVPPGIEVLHPQKLDEVVAITSTFFEKYYADSKPRQLLFGINPGRFGAGTTGINFTAPRQLQQQLGIGHSFKDQSELSAEFIYEVINEYGGPGKFYGDFFLTSVCPLGFTKDGRNLNYYDSVELAKSVESFIVDSIEQQISIFRPGRKCICIGGEKNFRYLSKLNEKHKFFDAIIPVAHPRFILQYRRKQKDLFLLEYASALRILRDTTASGGQH